jgi:uncharacterized protein (DUF58 family)
MKAPIPNLTRPARSSASPARVRAGRDPLFHKDAPLVRRRRPSRRRSIRLTADGLRFIVLAIGIGAAAVNTGNNLLYLLFSLMLSLIIVSGILSERCFKGLDIGRRLPSSVWANEPASAAFVLVNRKGRTAGFSLRVEDVVNGTVMNRDVRVLHLPSGASSIIPYRLVMSRRGRYEFEAIKVSTRFPFGLFVKAARIPCPASVIVYPEIKPLPGSLSDELMVLGHENALLRRGQGTALHNLRVYQPGDDSRTIHWRTTARKSQLIVRETEAEDQRRVTLVLALPSEAEMDAERRAHFEHAVSLAASLAVRFTRDAYEIRLLVEDQEIPYGMGEAQLARMLVALALCEPMAASPVDRTHRVPEEAATDGELRFVVLPWAGKGRHLEPVSIGRVVVASELH